MIYIHLLSEVMESIKMKNFPCFTLL